MKASYVFATLILMMPLASAEETEFDLKRAQAIANTETMLGAIYDRTLAQYIMSLPGTEAGMAQCLQQPGPKTVTGYFQFEASGSYSVILRPQSSFASCLSQVLEGKEPPKPHQLPYLNAFSFSQKD